MASTTEDVIVRYRAEVDQFTKELDAIILKQDEIIKNEVQQEGQEKKTVTAAQHAASKRKQLIIQEEAEIKKLRQLRALAFDPKQIEKYNSRLEESKRNIALLRGETGKLGSTSKNVFGDITRGITAAFSVTAIVSFLSHAGQVNRQLDIIKNTFEFFEGSVEAGAESFEFLEDLTQRLGLELLSTAQAFKQFAASARLSGIDSDKTKQIFTQVSTAVTALGLSAQDAEGVFLALSQIISKGTVAAEELRGQIGERLPGAFELAAKAMGVTTKELNKMLEQGLVKSTEFLPKFARELENTFGGALGAASKSSQAELNRLTNLWTKFSDFWGGLVNEVIMGAGRLALTLGDLPGKLTKSIEEFFTGKSATDIQKNSFKDFTAQVKEAILNTESLNELEVVATKLRTDQSAKIREQIVVTERLQDALDKAKTRQVINLKEIAALETAITKQRETNQKNEENKLFIIEKLITEGVVRLSQQEGINAAVRKEVELIKALPAAYNDLFKLLDKDGIDKLLNLWLESTKGVQEFRQAVAEATKEMQELIKLPDKLEQDPARPTDTPIAQPGFFPERLQAFLDENEQIISSTKELFTELASLASAYTDQRVAEINRTRDAELASLDVQQEAINKQLEKRRISETTAEALSEQLDQKRLTAEKKAADESRKIKRKAAILEKAAAIINITISTAEAVAKALTAGPYVGAVLAAIYGALGAAQAALVASQPIPYKKGSKKTRAGLSIVGEEGPELIQMPAGAKVLPAKQTHKYSDLIDAMFDNNIHQFVNYDSAPKLTRAKQKREEITQQSFAKNIAQSIIVNSDWLKVANAIEKSNAKGIKVTNMEEAMERFARTLSPDIYRR